MQNFVARCTVLAIIGAGFTATGDLAHVLSRGRRLIEAVDVPDDPATQPPATGATSTPTPKAAAAPLPLPPVPTPQPSPAAGPAQPASGPMRPAPAERSASTQPVEDARQPFDHRPPANGPERIDVAALRAGDRLTIWLRPTATAAPLRIVCDVIDPAAGEILVNGSLTTGAPARGVLCSATGRPTSTLVRGTVIHMQRVAPGGGPAPAPLAAGTIAALASGGSFSP